MWILLVRLTPKHVLGSPICSVQCRVCNVVLLDDGRRLQVVAFLKEPNMGVESVFSV